VIRAPEALAAAAFFFLAVLTFFWIPGVGIVLALISIIVGIIAVIGANRVVLVSGVALAIAGVVVIPTIHPVAGIVILLFGGAMCATSMVIPVLRR
jgi:hypothetical protein